MVSTQTWDALLLPNPRSSCLRTDGDRYRNLVPFVQFVEEPGTENCRLFFVVDGFITFDSPVMVAGSGSGQRPRRNRHLSGDRTR
jgi:hypothetical protein